MVVERALDFIDDNWRAFIRYVVYIGLVFFYVGYSEMKKKEQLRQEQNRRD